VSLEHGGEKWVTGTFLYMDPEKGKVVMFLVFIDRRHPCACMFLFFHRSTVTPRMVIEELTGGRAKELADKNRRGYRWRCRAVNDKWTWA
jgi:hypothetical protein